MKIKNTLILKIKKEKKGKEEGSILNIYLRTTLNMFFLCQYHIIVTIDEKKIQFDMWDKICYANECPPVLEKLVLWHQ